MEPTLLEEMPSRARDKSVVKRLITSEPLQKKVDVDNQIMDQFAADGEGVAPPVAVVVKKVSREKGGDLVYLKCFFFFFSIKASIQESQERLCVQASGSKGCKASERSAGCSITGHAARSTYSVVVSGGGDENRRTSSSFDCRLGGSCWRCCKKILGSISGM